LRSPSARPELFEVALGEVTNDFEVDQVVAKYGLVPFKAEASESKWRPSLRR
jgi:hypothetical protein